ncbi:MAG: hypothetical protein H6848_03575 [Caulobacterales bacterium]|nr:hypothetical protein [Caulobacterales bacterium]
MMKFIASSLDAAKAKAKRALGDKAVIVSVRNLPSGDVEIQASDKPQPAAPISKRIEPTFGGEARAMVDERQTRPAAGARLSAPLEQRYAEDALAKLRGDLTRKSPSSAPAFNLSDKTVQGMTDILKPHSIGERLLADLIEGARQARIDEDLYRLETAFMAAFDYSPLGFAPSAPLMLVGPTGAGKTSCAAKLAASAMDSGMEAFLMTADAGRAGAVEQIRTYGDSLGIDYFVVETPQDVERALELYPPTGAVLLDTPGVSPFDAGDIAALRCFQEALKAEAILVLPASGDVEEFKEWSLAFREFGVRRAIITKFDATKRVGAALTAVHEAGMALAHFSESAFISDGMMPASAEFLARRFLASRPGRVS